MSDFKKFQKIEHIGKLFMTITQKIHGSNAQILIYEEDGKLELKTGCRTRWITPEADNFGFSSFVHDNKSEFIEKLGLGRHFGEWAGPGINSGEGLKEKTLFLFNTFRYEGKLLPSRVRIIPELHSGKFSHEVIDNIFNHLKTYGSKAVEGYMSPEGIVIELGGQFYKKVFNPEETKWTSKNKIPKPYIPSVDVSHLLQPIRLEKLLSRDEAYIRNYPESLSSICKAYVADLEIEAQIVGTPEEITMIKKQLGKHIFAFVKEQILK